MSRISALALLCGLVSVSFADDWPQWMGKNRNGVWEEKDILTEFPKEGLKPVWKQDIFGGYTGPCVAAGQVIVMDYQITKGALKNDPGTKPALKGVERVVSFDAKTGKENWKYVYPCNYEVSYGCGPRCTPTVDGENVYCLGTMGDLCCLSIKDGKKVWTKNFREDYKAEVPLWGFCSHPLVYKNSLICLVGGQGSLIVAFDKLTGKELWKAIDEKDQGYCPPSIIQAHGKDHLVIWHPKAIVGLDPVLGKTQWSVPLSPRYSMSIMAPQSSGETIFAGGIGGQAVAFKIPNKADMEVQEHWRGNRKLGIFPANTTPLIHNNTIYGCNCDDGHLIAVDLMTGKRHWEATLPINMKSLDDEKPHGTVFIVRNQEHYYLFNEDGELISAELTPKSYKELSRTKLIEPTGTAFGRKVVWSHPAFANQCIYVRNDQELCCYSLKK